MVNYPPPREYPYESSGLQIELDGGSHCRVCGSDTRSKELFFNLTWKYRRADGETQDPHFFVDRLPCMPGLGHGIDKKHFDRYNINSWSRSRDRPTSNVPLAVTVESRCTSRPVHSHRTVSPHGKERPRMMISARPRQRGGAPTLYQAGRWPTRRARCDTLSAGVVE